MIKEDRYKIGQRWLSPGGYILEIISLDHYENSLVPEHSCHCKIISGAFDSFWVLKNFKLISNQDKPDEIA